MVRKTAFVNGAIYHVYNRGVEKRRVFGTEKDYFRFVHDLFGFNDVAPALNTGYYSSGSHRTAQELRKPRKLLLEILCFCLMPDHYHLLVRQRVESGITEFMRKLGTGYTNYFNQKYQRVGPLFQGKFKSVQVTRQAHLLYLPHYIHLNPLDLRMPEWRRGRLRSVANALAFLESYRWSSYRDYLGAKNFPSVTQRDFIRSIYGSRTSIDYEEEVREWLEHLDFEPVQDLTIEKPMEVGLR